MTGPLVFHLHDFRAVWVERGLAWVWSRARHRWWPIDHRWLPYNMSGRVLTEAQRLELVAEVGTPFQPRVTAPGELLACSECGAQCFARDVFHGAKSFCCFTHREQWLHRQPVIDQRSARG